LTLLSSILVNFTDELKMIPPVFMTFTYMFGFSLFNLIPTDSSSLVILAFYSSPFDASRTIIIMSDDLPTAMTYLPLPLPLAAPSMIPGRSRS
jgi:hypothetical protein